MCELGCWVKVFGWLILFIFDEDNLVIWWFILFFNLNVEGDILLCRWCIRLCWKLSMLCLINGLLMSFIGWNLMFLFLWILRSRNWGWRKRLLVFEVVLCFFYLWVCYMVFVIFFGVMGFGEFYFKIIWCFSVVVLVLYRMVVIYCFWLVCVFFLDWFVCWVWCLDVFWCIMWFCYWFCWFCEDLVLLWCWWW